MKDRRSMNRLLGESGLAQLNDPGVIPQLASLVRDDAHFGRLVCACDPEDRTTMYEAMAPNLAFKARPLHDYLIEAQRDAEARQLPIQQADGTLRAFNLPQIQTTVQKAVDAALLDAHLVLTCRKCTKQATFHGARKADAVRQARLAGWVYDAVSGPEPFEICPTCPGGAGEAKPSAAKCSWCGGDAEEDRKHFEGPHTTWCPHFRESQRGGGVA